MAIILGTNCFTNHGFHRVGKSIHTVGNHHQKAHQHRISSDDVISQRCALKGHKAKYGLQTE
ncbi:Uncharacterised protein [Vibrio cholerae]|nr:Uncharacterised protein [Vibrio cholerae]CSI76113.1 Uncharacterised protein [Vibrio cholerae]